MHPLGYFNLDLKVPSNWRNNVAHLTHRHIYSMLSSRSKTNVGRIAKTRLSLHLFTYSWIFEPSFRQAKVFAPYRTNNLMISLSCRRAARNSGGFAAGIRSRLSVGACRKQYCDECVVSPEYGQVKWSPPISYCVVHCGVHVGTFVEQHSHRTLEHLECC